MTKEQAVISLIAKLITKRGVSAPTVERAIDDVLDIKLGDSITGENPLVRAFATEQATRLLKGK
jgi:hypothetical protein